MKNKVNLTKAGFEEVKNWSKKIVNENVNFMVVFDECVDRLLQNHHTYELSSEYTKSKKHEHFESDLKDEEFFIFEEE